MNIYPDLILGGAQKCGTSSLSIWLNQHPQLQCSIPKEPDFFLNKNIYQSKNNYSQYFAPDTSNPKLLFEASTGYFTDSTVPQRIYERLGNKIKFIFILRNPVDRTVSAYYHMFKRNADKREIEDVFSDIPENIDLIKSYEDEKLKYAKANLLIDTKNQERYDDHYLQFRYIHNSLYSKHYQNFINYFPSENILLISLDNLINNPRKEFDRITNYLCINEYDKLPDVHKAFNRTFIPIYLQSKFLRNNNNCVFMLQNIHAIARKFQLHKYLIKKAPELNTEIEDYLNNIFVSEFEFMDSVFNTE